LGISGVGVIVDPTFYSFYLNKNVDFTGLEWFLGGGLILIGCLLGFSTFKKKTIKTDIVVMCPKCVKPFNKKGCEDLKCPECKATVEGMSGFYELHPELKNKKTGK
jgi:hypothetical protein